MKRRPGSHAARFTAGAVTVLLGSGSWLARGPVGPTDRQAGPAAQGRVPSYDLAIHLMPQERRLKASGTIRIPAEPVPTSSMRFALRLDMGTPAVRVLEPRACAGDAGVTDAGRDGDLLVTRLWDVTPGRACPAGASILLRVSYAGGSDHPAGFFNLGPEGSFGSGVNSAWYPVVGGLRGTGSLRFTVPRGVVVVASGAPAPRRDHGDSSTFTFTSSRPSYLGFAAGPYTVIRRRDGPVPVALYLFREREATGELLAALSQAMEVLQREFGPYPFGEFALVEAPADAGRAAGFLGIAFEGFFLARSDYLDQRTVDLAYLGHELSHEWFPFVVGGRGGRTTLMLDEALAHYGSLRTVEELAGSAAAERHRRGDGDAVRLIAAGFDFPLGDLPDERASYALSNSKGYVVYDMLSRAVGRDRFRAALATVTRTHAFGRVTLQELLREIERAAGQDLGWFYRQWFDRGDYPVLALAWSQDRDSLRYTITQASPPYRIGVPVQIELEDGSARLVTAEVARETTAVTMAMSQRVHAVRLDPHFEVFHATPAQRAEAEELRYFTRGNLLWNSNRTDEALRTFQEGLQHLPEPDGHGVEFLLRLHVGWIDQEAGRLAEARDEYLRALAQPIRPASYLPRLYVNLATVAQELGDSEAAVRAARNVLSSERALGQETRRSQRAREILSRMSGSAPR